MPRRVAPGSWVRPAALFAVGGCVLLGAGCSPRGETGRGAPALIQVDGSSTVYPVTEAVAEEFQARHPGVRVTVGISGTGGGLTKFCGGEIDIANASRSIAPPEIAACAERRIGYIELPVAYDGIAIVVNLQNTWVDYLTVRELKTMWEPAAQGTITRWSQIRAGWPDQEIHLFGAGVDSGTYDYFTEAIVGTEHASRGDFTASEDDNVLVQGVATDPLAVGFFGLSYYEQNKERLKLVPIDDGDPRTGQGPIRPTADSVRNGTYQPLSRPILIYVGRQAADRPAVRDFVAFYLSAGRALVAEVGYVPLSDRVYDLALRRFANRTEGSLFRGRGSQVGVNLDTLLASEPP